MCLHCGELAPDGALFCTKCGFVLPQVDGNVPPPPPPARVPSGSPTGATYVPASSAPPGGVPGAYAMPTAPAGAMPPIPPPPSGKYCIRCRTIISRSAVYCPVCQQPQGP